MYENTVLEIYAKDKGKVKNDVGFIDRIRIVIDQLDKAFGVYSYEN